MPVAGSYGTKGTENGYTATGTRVLANATLPVILFNHGLGGSALTANDSVNQGVTAALVERGYMVQSNDMGGTGTLMNATAQTKESDAKTYAQAGGGGKAGKVGILGRSGGGALAAIWALANPSLVACVGLIVPLTDLAYEHDHDTGGNAAAYETATGISGTYAGNGAVTPFDPQQNVTALVATGIPFYVWYASNDAQVTPARQQAFITAMGCGSTNMGAVGHTGSASASGVVDFFKAHL